MSQFRAASPVARAALVIAALALVSSLSGVTGAGAVGVVRRALLSGNARTVEGIRASRTPVSGQLLALDGSRQFPASVLPASARGPRGPVGPTGGQRRPGATGPTGPSDAYRATATGTEIGSR